MIGTYTQTPTLTKSKPGNCGCSDSHGDCCKLECLTRPNFFCGQVLTDEDLKALVDWTASRTALQRYREGWGVACGLEVTCSHEYQKSSRVTVAPGYGIDCCGRDIVVCDPIYYDFECEKPFDPCCPEPKADPLTGAAPPAAPQGKLGCIPLAELRAFELCLRFDERLTGGQRALARGNCSPLNECQYTRVVESGKLYAKELLDPCTPPPRLVEKNYREALIQFLNELKRYQSSAKELREWVRGKLHSFCFVEDCLCELLEAAPEPQQQSQPKKVRRQVYAAPGNPPDLSELIFYIVQDWRNHYFQRLCATCGDNICEDDGIPLARVWLWNKTEADCKICKVVQVDSYPPYRRLLGRDSWTSRPGCIDLSRYIWREVDEVRQEFHKLGLTISQTPVFEAANTIELLQHDANDYICAPETSSVILRRYPDICGRDRVVTFGG